MSGIKNIGNGPYLLDDEQKFIDPQWRHTTEVALKCAYNNYDGGLCDGC